MRLNKKVAIVTGGASGIGRATAILFAREGAKVIVADIDQAGGQETVSRIQKQNGEAIFVPTDVSKLVSRICNPPTVASSQNDDSMPTHSRMQFGDTAG